MSHSAARPPLRAAFASLHNRNYRVYFTGQLLSQIGTWMQSTALSWYVIERTESPLVLGTVSLFQFLPVLLLSLFGGVIADRFPKRQLLMCTQSVMALQATTLALLTVTDMITLPVIFGLVAIQGAANALDMPSRQALVMEIVGPRDVPNAVALNASQMQMTRLTGPAIAGVILAVFGASVCFFVNAFSFLAVLTGLFMLDPKRFILIERAKQAPMFKQLGEGLRYAFTTPDILVAIMTIAVMGTFGFNMQVMTPLIANGVLNTNSIGFGLLTSTMAVGSLTAALLVAWIGRATRKSVLTSALCFSVVLLAIGLSRSWYVILPLYLVLGLCSSTFTASNSARLQLLSPPHLRGRIMSMNTMLFAGTTPIGSMIIGTTGEHAGVGTAVAMMGGICLAGVGLVMLYIRRNRHRLQPADADPRPAPPAEGAAAPPGTAGSTSQKTAIV